MSDPEGAQVGRPIMPEGYGIAREPEGQLPWSWAEERLTASRNYWIVTAGESGWPHAMPVWGVWLEGGLFFSTSRASRKGRNLAANPRLIVHLESGDEAVILRGRVAVPRDRAMLLRADAAYAAKYVDAASGQGFHLPTDPDGDDGVYVLRPAVVLAWREQDFPTSATRWQLSVIPSRR